MSALATRRCSGTAPRPGFHCEVPDPKTGQLAKVWVSPVIGTLGCGAELIRVEIPGAGAPPAEEGVRPTFVKPQAAWVCPNCDMPDPDAGPA